MARAMETVCGSALTAASLCSSAFVMVASAMASASWSWGTGSPSATASPRGVGTQNRPGWTKANSSSKSSAGKASIFSRRAMAGI